MSINFKNVLIYKLSRDVSFANLEEQMAQFAFTPCGSQDMAKTGWISPMGNESATLAHVANKQILITLQCEKRIYLRRLSPVSWRVKLNAWNKSNTVN